MPQAPTVHVATMFGRTGHALPQTPQLLVLVSTLTSQPSVGSALQLAKPALHAMLQPLPMHTGLAFARAGHTVVQPPQ